jgi:hypothetical protein
MTNKNTIVCNKAINKIDGRSEYEKAVSQNYTSFLTNIFTI